LLLAPEYRASSGSVPRVGVASRCPVRHLSVACPWNDCGRQLSTAAVRGSEPRVERPPPLTTSTNRPRAKCEQHVDLGWREWSSSSPSVGRTWVRAGGGGRRGLAVAPIEWVHRRMTRRLGYVRAHRWGPPRTGSRLVSSRTSTPRRSAVRPADRPQRSADRSYVRQDVSGIGQDVSGIGQHRQRAGHERDDNFGDHERHQHRQRDDQVAPISVPTIP
jgi:hypothetical protein